MLETLLAIYIVGMIGYLLFSGFVVTTMKGGYVASYPLLITATILWPLFITMALGAGLGGIVKAIRGS